MTRSRGRKLQRGDLVVFVAVGAGFTRGGDAGAVAVSGRLRLGRTPRRRSPPGRRRRASRSAAATLSSACSTRARAGDHDHRRATGPAPRPAPAHGRTRPAARAIGASTGCVGQLEVEPPAAGRAVGQEPDPLLGAVPHHPVVSASRKNGFSRFCTVVIGAIACGLPDLVHATRWTARPSGSCPARWRSAERADAVRQRHGGIGRVQLVEVDALDPQRREGPLAGGAELLRAAVGVPAPAGAHQPALGGHDDLVAVAAPAARAPARSAARCARCRVWSRQ